MPQRVSRVGMTGTAAALPRRLIDRHGPVMFHQSGGCCDGSAPMCYPEGEFRVGGSDVLLGYVGDDTPFWMGADQYEKLASWHRPEELKRLAKIAVVGRPGIQLKEKAKLIPMESMPVSASEIRARAKRGEDLGAFVPPAVANYIARRRLYS